MTVEAVDPANFAASFGDGVRLERATVEIMPKGIWPLNEFGFTGTPMTTGIEKRLGWLQPFPEPSLSPSNGSTNPPIAALVHHGDFRR
jgi:hypothetical protein